MAKRVSKKKDAEAPFDAAPAEGAASAVESKPAKGGARGKGGRGGGKFPPRGTAYTPGSAKDRHLVIVESPSKAKTINKYLGRDYLVLASVGHVRDLPSKNPKGVKSPVPGVDLEHKFKPSYQVLEGKEKVVSDLKRAAKETLASGKEIWFATDLDREGEAIAWHLAQELGIPSAKAKRVMFAAITKAEIERAFQNPHPIDEDRVNAQQARRIVDRIVGYQVSPLLWKKVTRGLSAGRVQSVAVRLIVARERQIKAFVPDEEWGITGYLALDPAKAGKLGGDWTKFQAQRDEKGNPPTVKAQNEWLSDRGVVRAELVEFAGKKFEPALRMDTILGVVPEWLSPEQIETRLKKAAAEFKTASKHDLTPEVVRVAQACGVVKPVADVREDEKGRGPARWVRTVSGVADPSVPWRVESIETKRVKSRPSPPFITSTLQQAAANRLGFAAQRTMRAAQQLYEGVDIPGEGPVGLITYMRTDSTHLSGDAIRMAREYIGPTFGDKYLPEKPNFFTSSNKDAQEAHEAIRPTNVSMTPSRVKDALSPDQLRLYTLIWERFVACQMTPAEWDSTTVLIKGGTSGTPTFRASGRVLVFDGFYRVAGIPKGDELNLPVIKEQQPLHAFDLDVRQRFGSPPPRYTEASLIKTLESEGIGRPSTYASIISVIQERKYVEQQERRFFATDLGEVVTDKLIEGFPDIMDVGYTREMELQLDKIEEDHLDWIAMLQKFYDPFKQSLDVALDRMTHAKAELTPAPYPCPTCGKATVYRFGKNGRFLSCSTYPECKYAAPVDREGKPAPAAETVDVACPKCGSAMTARTGRFGRFLGCSKYGDKKDPCDGILNVDPKGKVVAPSQPPLVTDLPCPTCQNPLNLRNGLKGPWLGCSRFPKCRGRGKWAEVEEKKRAELEKAMKAHEAANQIPIIRTLDGRALTDDRGKALLSALPVDQLSLDPSKRGAAEAEALPDEAEV